MNKNSRGTTHQIDRAAEDPGYRKNLAGGQVLRRYFKDIDHAVKSRQDSSVVCEAVASGQCGLSTENLMGGTAPSRLAGGRETWTAPLPMDSTNAPGAVRALIFSRSCER